MKFTRIITAVALLSAYWTSTAQCISGGCEVGLSTSQTENGTFIGNYESGKKSGLGIIYNSSLKEETAQYSHYIAGKKEGVEYTQTYNKVDLLTTHTFIRYYEGMVIYPAFRITKENRKTLIEVAFNDNGEWKKHSGDQTRGRLKVENIIREGNPTFLAFNGPDEVMAISATVSSIEVLGSSKTDKYYSGFQLDLNEDRILVDVLPKDKGYSTRFMSTPNWNIENPDDGEWLYKRYFNEEIIYEYNYKKVLELPSKKEVKEQKLEEAFTFVAEQVDEYDFEKGYKGKVKDFIDMLIDIKERAEIKGLEISSTYDITMMKLYLQEGDRSKSLYYAENAYRKSPSSYTRISKVITTRFNSFEDILERIKKRQNNLAVSNLQTTRF